MKDKLKKFVRAMMRHMNAFPDDKVCVDYVKDCMIDEYLRLKGK